MTDQGNVKYVGAVLAKGIYVGSAKVANYGDGSVTIPEQPAAITLRDFPYPFGYAMDWDKTGRPDYTPMFLTGNIITPENATGMGHINPSSKFTFDANTTIAQISDPNNYNWDFVEINKIIAFAEPNDIELHYAHVLWNMNNTAVGATRTRPQKPHVEALKKPEQLEAYIIMFCKYVFGNKLKDKFKGVNVTNEMVNDFNDAATGGLNKTNNIWTEVLTLERATYVATKAIREVDSVIDIGINDYNLETGNMSRTNRYIAVDDYLRGLNETVNGRQIKLDFVGFQTHTGTGLNMTVAGSRFKIWADRGTKVSVTEFDTTTGNPYSLTGTPPTMESVKAAVLNVTLNLVKAYESNVPKSLRYAFMLWTASERDFLKNAGKKAPGTYTYNTDGTKKAYVGIEHFNGIFDYYGARKDVFYAVRDYNLNRP